MHLEKVMQNAVFDFNLVRPYGALKGLTPMEAYLGKKVDIEKEKRIMKLATQKRVMYNRTHKCNGCPFGCSKLQYIKGFKPRELVKEIFQNKPTRSSN